MPSRKLRKQENDLRSKLAELEHSELGALAALRTAQATRDRAARDCKLAEVEHLRGLGDRRKDAQAALVGFEQEAHDAEMRREAIPQAAAATRAAINDLIETNLTEVHADALDAEKKIATAVTAAVQAVDHLAAVTDTELRWIERLRPIPLDGVMIGLEAGLNGSIEQARTALATLTVQWPTGIDPTTGRYTSAAQRRAENIARQLEERKRAWQTFSGEKAS